MLDSNEEPPEHLWNQQQIRQPFLLLPLTLKFEVLEGRSGRESPRWRAGAGEREAEWVVRELEGS